MKLEILKEIIKKKENKSEFAIVTKLSTGESEIFIDKKPLSKNFDKYTEQIENFYNQLFPMNRLLQGLNLLYRYLMILMVQFQ